MNHLPGCLLVATHEQPCITEADVQNQNRAESLARLGGEQGPDADELEVFRLRARVRELESLLRQVRPFLSPGVVFGNPASVAEEIDAAIRARGK